MNDDRRNDAWQDDGDGDFRPDFEAFDGLTEASKSSMRVIAELLYRKCNATLLAVLIAMLLVFYLGVRSLDDRSELTDGQRATALVTAMLIIASLAVIAVFAQINMARIPKKGEVCRLTLQTSVQVRDRMEKLRDATDADSLVEVIRRSLAVYESLMKAHQDGATVIIRKGDSEQELLLVP